MIRHVIYIVETPLSTRDRERFGIDGWQSVGVRVQVWEVDRLYLPRPSSYVRERQPGLDRRFFSSEDELVSECESLQSDTAVIVMSGVYLGEFASHRRMLTALMRSRALLTTVSAGTRPPDRSDPRSETQFHYLMSRTHRLLRRIHNRPSIVFNLARKMIEKISVSLFLLAAKWGRAQFRTLDWVWVATNFDSINPALLSETTHTRFVHTWDYERAHQFEPTGLSFPPRPVYLDAMGPLHPDFKILNYEIQVSPEDWFQRINIALKHLDKSLGEKIVVAAHPRAEQGSLEPYYPDRKVIYGQTPPLIRAAPIVLFSDPSTSLSLAALFRRPAIAIRVPELWNGQWLEMRAYIEELNLRVVDYSGLPDNWEPPSVDEELYVQFVERYVKRKDSARRPFWDAVRADIASVAN